MSEEKPCNGGRSMFRTIGFKDHKGDKSSCLLFGKLSQKVVDKKVYKLSNFKRGDFIRSKDYFHWMKANPNTSTLVEVKEDKILSSFKNIFENDGIISGVVIAYEPPKIYHSCVKCKRSVGASVTHCPHCGSEGSKKDFNTTLIIEEEESRKIQEVYLQTLLCLNRITHLYVISTKSRSSFFDQHCFPQLLNRISHQQKK